MITNKKFRIALKIFSTVLVIAIIAAALLLGGIRIFGVEVYTVLSGSMEPEYQTGSLIYVIPVDEEDLEVNDVITFRLSGSTIATHRIIEIVPDEADPSVMLYRTKGDANEVADGRLVSYGDIIGTPVLHIPRLGIIANQIQSPPGIYYAIACGAAVILLVLIIDMVTDEKKINKSKKFEEPQFAELSDNNEAYETNEGESDENKN